MKNKKGFTIVELVIVIAVIAILAAVLIPTFSSLIKKSQRTAELQAAESAMQIVVMETKAVMDGTYYIVTSNYSFEYNYSDNGSYLVTDEKEIKSSGKEINDIKSNKLSGESVQYFAHDIDTAVSLGTYRDNGDTKKAINTTDDILENSDINKKVIVISKKTATEE